TGAALARHRPGGTVVDGPGGVCARTLHNPEEPDVSSDNRGRTHHRTHAGASSWALGVPESGGPGVRASRKGPTARPESAVSPVPPPRLAGGRNHETVP